jgi:subfamily B ATP-binding cassette protein MsbA
VRLPPGPLEPRSEDRSDLRLYRRLLGYLWPHRGISALAFLVMLVYAVLDGVSLVMFVPFLRILFGGTPLEGPADLGLGTLRSSGEERPPLVGGLEAVKDGVLQALAGESRMETLTNVCLAILAVFLLKGLVNYVQLMLPRIVEERAARDLRSEVFAHLHRLSFPYLQRMRGGKLVNVVVTDISRIKPMFSMGVHRLAQKVLEAIIGVSVLLYINWRLALLTLVVVPPLVFVTIRLARRLRTYQRRAMAQFAELTSRVQENLFLMRVIQAFAQEPREVRRFRSDNRAYYRTALKASKYAVAGAPLSDFIVTSGVVTILWYGGYLVLVRGVLAPEMFFLFLGFTVKLGSPMRFLSQFNEAIQPALAAAERLFGVLDATPDVEEARPAVPLTGFRDRIVYEDVHFEYEGSGSPPALRGVSLEIGHGEVVALVGPSGAGKSTLVDLLPRFYDPSRGRILIDGVDLRRVRLRDLRGLLGIVTQETLLFHDTVRVNIAYANPEASDAAIEDAARAANAWDFIQALPQGLDTVLGERGLRLSGGERQRIAIARALLKDPPILIFDEATSSLDNTSERLVQEAIYGLLRDRTAVVIAHRLSTVRHADRIVVLDAGRVVDTGTHAELLARGGLYRDLHDAQFQDLSFRGRPAATGASVGG